MESESLKGALDNGAGRLESAAGEALDDPKLKVKGEARQFRGKVEAAAEAALEKVGAAALKAADQASETYDSVRSRALTTADATDIFIKTRPYAALGLAVLAGFVIGAHILRGGPKVIYIKPVQG